MGRSARGSERQNPGLSKMRKQILTGQERRDLRRKKKIHGQSQISILPVKKLL